eukprot:gnl/MRDRNA2_/MRDRNA2_94868_c0_seq1.p1 gnl/MRDRNA2_/MRDRNA2_94868_c0~~gnl/MRDRNA2_/MRDRNA2_94868_c0_seq1.p1  ORF type:complete len:430 (-),score=70.61 gnl/MRDRNA2_/MRDRNA2_94868_c0_seq1:82-1371(-)
MPPTSTLRPSLGPSLRPEATEAATMPYSSGLLDKVNKGTTYKTETDRKPGIEGWDAMPATDCMRPQSARETGCWRSPSRLTGKLTYGLQDDQRCWSSPCSSWGPVPRPVSAASGERRPKHMDRPVQQYDHSGLTAFPRSGRPCSAGTLGEGFRATHRGRTPPATTTWERGGPRGGTPIGSICQQLHLIKATKGQYAGLSRIIGKPGGGAGAGTRGPRSRKDQRRDSEDSDDYILLPTADPNRRLSDYERALRSQQLMRFEPTQKEEPEEPEEEYQLGPRQKQEILERQQRWAKISNQMEALDKQLDVLDNKLKERAAANEYNLSADIRRSAIYVRERINNLQRDIIIEDKLQPPPDRLPRPVLKELTEEFIEVQSFVERGAVRVEALEARVYLQQRDVREGKDVGSRWVDGFSSPEPPHYPKAQFVSTV